MERFDGDELSELELDAMLKEWGTPTVPARLKTALFPAGGTGGRGWNAEDCGLHSGCVRAVRARRRRRPRRKRGTTRWTMAPMSVWVDGKKWQGTAGTTGKPGATFWVAIPGAGRYILSLISHAGARKGGVVRDYVLAFEDGGDSYEVRLGGPVAGAGKAWNLYWRMMRVTHLARRLGRL